MIECVDFIKNNLYSRVEDVKDNFKSITKQACGRAVAVDGGASIINDGGSWILSKIRTASTYYDKGKRIPDKESIKDYYMSLIMKGGKYCQRLSPDVSLNNEYKGVRDLVEAVPIAMKSMEYCHAVEQVSELSPGDLLLLDGPFRIDSPDHDKLLKDLELRAKKAGVHVVGVSKTCRFELDGKSAIGALLRSKPRERWIYHPISDDDSYVVKLHEKSSYAYMINVFPHSHSCINDVAGVLCYYSRDPQLLGYPYPLLRADKVGRVSEHERRQEESRLRILSKKDGYGFLETDKRAMDMHSRLDKGAYR